LGLYLIGQAAETVIFWGISDRTGNRNRNIGGVYLIREAAETVIFGVYI